MIYFLTFIGLFLGLVLVGDNVILLSLISLVLLLFIYKRFGKKITLFFLVAFVVGVGVSFINIKINPISGTYTGIVIDARSNYYIVWSRFEKLIVYESNSQREVGDIVKIQGNISNLIDTTLESEFSFVNYLKNCGVTRELQASSINVVFANFIKINAYKRWFLSLFSESARDYVDAFLFNVKNYDAQSTQLMGSLNMVYLFSSSGIYLSLIFRIVEYLLFLKLDQKHTKLASLILLSWYLLLASNKIGVRRIIYVKTFSYINKYHSKYQYDHLSLTSIVGITMLTFNHYLARQSGFYIGFFISFAFYFARSALNYTRKTYVISKTSIFAFLFVLPITLCDAHVFHVFGIFIQMVLMPYTFMFMLIALISLYSYPIVPLFNFMGNVLTNLMKGLKIIDINVPFKESGGIFLLAYYLILLLIIYFLEEYSYKKVCFTLVAGISLFLVKITPYENLYADSITFLNVGQGDSALVRHKQYSILIDTGGLTYKDIATNVTIPYLRKEGINHLDYVFISHSDYDHSGALTSLKANYRVNQIIDTQEPFAYNIGGLKISNLNEWANEYTDENDKSQVLTFKAANKNILMMGDASTNIENKLMNKYKDEDFKIDVLKLGHHGSNTSSSYEFLSFIKPKEAVISVGYKNKYNHPSKEVIQNLNNLKIPYSRTDEKGSISFSAITF